MPCLMVRGTATGSSPRGCGRKRRRGHHRRSAQNQSKFLAHKFCAACRGASPSGFIGQTPCTMLWVALGLNSKRHSSHRLPPNRVRGCLPNRPLRVPGLPSLELPSGRGATRSGAGCRDRPPPAGGSRRAGAPASSNSRSAAALRMRCSRSRDIGLEVVADEVRPLLVAGIDQHAVAHRDIAHDVVDLALDRFPA